jgi:hypothetical protein
MVAGVGLAGAGVVLRSVENMSNSMNGTPRRKVRRKVKRSGSVVSSMDNRMKKGKSKVNKMVFG